MHSVRVYTGLVAIAASVGLTAATPNATQALSSVPAWFEPNAGQFDPKVKFFSRGGSGTLLVAQDGVTLRAGKDALGVTFRGASAKALPEGIDRTAARTTYMIGSDRSKWKPDIEHFARVRTRQIYSGVDAVYYLSGSELEFDLVVAPGSDPRSVRMAFDGAGRPRLDTNGDLVFANGVRQKRPVAYQQTDGGRSSVEATYQIAESGEVRFAVARYDRSKPLVIDPILQSFYMGGDRNERAQAITVDKDGVIWVTGSSMSTYSVFGQVDPVQDLNKGGRDIFLAKLTADSGGRLNLVYWTQLGGAGDEEATAIVSDSNGFLYMTGQTSSADFLQAGTIAGGIDAFLVVIHPSDPGVNALWYAKYYGADGTDVGNTIALDAAGAVYIGGYTTSGSLPGVSAASAQGSNRGGVEGFFVKMTNGSIDYATFLGGANNDVITAVAVDAQGGVYLAGTTSSTDFPATFDAYRPDPATAFLAKLNIGLPGNDAILYCTYLLGSGLDVPKQMALDRTGSIWIGGYTTSTDLPVTNPYRNVNAGASDLFLLRFDYANRSTVAAITYLTYIGGSDGDVLYGMTFMPNGAVAVAGYTYSTDFPRVSGTPANQSRAPGAFVAVLDPARSGADQLIYSETVGGALLEAATGIASDAAGKLYVCGYTFSRDFFVTDGSQKMSAGGLSQSFVFAAQPPAIQ